MSMRNEEDAWRYLRAWIENLRATVKGKNSAHVVRFDRLMKYRADDFEQQKKIDKAWRALSKHSRDEDALLSVFLGLPDTVEVQPFTMLSFGKRLSDDPQSARQRYLEMAKHADELLKFLGRTAFADPMSQLLADQDDEDGWLTRLPKEKGAEKMHDHVIEARRMRQLGAGHQVKRDLLWLSHALKGANPHKWYLTKKPRARDAGEQTCAALVADLTRYLCKPQHQALAVLGNANLPGAKLTDEKIRSAWRPPEWWTELAEQQSKEK